MNKLKNFRFCNSVNFFLVMNKQLIIFNTCYMKTSNKQRKAEALSSHRIKEKKFHSKRFAEIQATVCELSVSSLAELPRANLK